MNLGVKLFKIQELIGFIGLVVFIEVLWVQNLVFNPGFDMTPWDTGWTITTNQLGRVDSSLCNHSAPQSCSLSVCGGSVGVYVTGPSWKTGASYGQIYVWIDDVYISGETGVEEKSNIKNQNAKIEAYPNPFRGKTLIRYESCVMGYASNNKHTTQDAQRTMIKIHDLAGRVVRTLPISENEDI